VKRSFDQDQSFPEATTDHIFLFFTLVVHLFFCYNFPRILEMQILQLIWSQSWWCEIFEMEVFILVRDCLKKYLRMLFTHCELVRFNGKMDKFMSLWKMLQLTVIFMSLWVLNYLVLACTASMGHFFLPCKLKVCWDYFVYSPQKHYCWVNYKFLFSIFW
jgi:hypothetical protein